MLHTILRVFFVLALLAVGMSYVEAGELLLEYRLVLLIGALLLAAVFIGIDMAIPRKSLKALSGVFVGLIVGLFVTYGLTLVLSLLGSAFAPGYLDTKPVYRTTIETLKNDDGTVMLDNQGLRAVKETKVQVAEADHPAIALTKLLLGIICCYLCISFVLQTKDDVRFVIPYVEFARQIKGQRPLLLDTSVIIDGRIKGICEAGFLDQKLVVPRFVLHELQMVADSSDNLKRARGRRGLDILNELQSDDNIDIEISDAEVPKRDADEGVDLKLLALARVFDGRVMTNDYNLNKVAKVRGVEVININDLVNALKPVALPGESMLVKIIKPGEEHGQGVGYLEDGTMVVVEQGRGKIGERVDVVVTSVLQTSAGRMIFGRFEGPRPPDKRAKPVPQRAS